MIVCDAGPLIALGGINHLELLRDLFGRVLAPAEVAREWSAGGLAHTGLGALQRAAWIEVKPTPHPPDPLLWSLLDPGEAGAIELARSHPRAALLMDEARGRKVARDIYGLPVIGTGRVLVEAKRAGLIAQVRPLLEAMRTNGYWLSDKLVAGILAQAAE